MAELMIITGPPGAGKSAVAAIVASTFDRSALVAGDQFFGFLAGGYISPWLADKHVLANPANQPEATARIIQDRITDGSLTYGSRNG